MFAPAEKSRFAPTKFAPNVPKKVAPAQISKIAMFAPKKLPLPTPQLYWKIAPWDSFFAYGAKICASCEFAICTSALYYSQNENPNTVSIYL